MESLTILIVHCQLSSYKQTKPYKKLLSYFNIHTFFMKSSFVIIEEKPNLFNYWQFFCQFLFKIEEFKKRNWMMISVLIKLFCLQGVLGVAIRGVRSMQFMQHFDSWLHGWPKLWLLKYQALIVAILYSLEVCCNAKKKIPILFNTVSSLYNIFTIFLFALLSFNLKRFPQNTSFLL